MPVIGVREFASIPPRCGQVREQKAEYVITYQGRPVAFLSPVDEEAVETAMVRAGRESAGDGWEAYLRLIEEIRSNRFASIRHRT